MSRQRRHKRRPRRAVRFAGLFRAISALAVAGAVVVACLVFFRVGEIDVRGNRRYTDADIISVTGVRVGDNLFAIRRGRLSRALQSKLPYVQTVSVRVLLPDTLQITVTEGDAAAAIAQDGRWWLLDSECKLLEETTGPHGYATVTGLTPVAPAVGTYLATGQETADKLALLREFLAAMADNDLLSGLESIDLTQPYQLTFRYDDRLNVHLSATLDQGTAYWIRRFAAALDNAAVDPNQRYTVDIADSQTLRFIPE